MRRRSEPLGKDREMAQAAYEQHLEVVKADRAMDKRLCDISEASTAVGRSFESLGVCFPMSTEHCQWPQMTWTPCPNIVRRKPRKQNHAAED